MTPDTANGRAITIIGAGISGLSCGIRLAEAGFAPTILARDLPPHTTAQAAAAIWYIFAAEPVARTHAWALTTLTEFYRLLDAGHGPKTGLSLCRMIEVFAEAQPDPWYAPHIRFYERVPPADIPAGYVDALHVELPLIHPAHYLPYLLGQFRARGGTIHQQEIRQLADIRQPGQLLINCSGVWAGQLADDPAVYSLRGQTVVIEAMPAINYLDESDIDRIVHIFHRGEDIILGGSAEAHRWDLSPDPALSVAIRERALAIAPQLQTARILAEQVGLRPGRHEIRLEREDFADGSAIIHNYGHGGAGFTLSWGCAEEVVALARAWHEDRRRAR
ncbi:MAG: FAD-dependent oxidoreductase [Chloroflexi bacterium]|nr:FAD-dependent oxidoreductase [Chloroflexota bacterium]